MRGLFDRLAILVVDHRWIPSLLILAISLPAAIGHWQPELVRRLLKSPQAAESNSDSSDTQAPPNVDPISISRADAVIVVQCDDFFTARSADALRAVVSDLEALDQVHHILWMDRVPVLNIFGLAEPILPRSSSSPTQFKAARQRAMAHPLIRGQLLSEDGHTLLLMVDYDDLNVLTDYDATDRLRDTAEATASRFPDLNLSFQVTGEVPCAIAAITEHESNQLKYQMVGYGMIGLMAIVLFRGLRAVAVVALAPVLGVFWTIGLVAFLDYSGNPLIDVILPILVSLVGLTDGVHLMVQIRKLRAAGLPEADAARLGLKQVGLACFLTSLTTAVGFGSLVLAESTWVQQFGKSCVVGVVASFIAVITVIPLVCSTWLGRNIHRGHEHSLIDKNLNRVSLLIDAVLARPRFFATAGIVSTAVLFGVGMQLRPDQKRTDGLPPAAEATLALQHMDTAFRGLEFSSVELRWDRSMPADSPLVLQAVTEVEDLLREEPLIGHPLSIRDLIDAQPGTGPPAERMSLLELVPPPLKRAFYTPESRTAVVAFRVRDLGIARYGPVFERLNTHFDRLAQKYPQFTFRLRGSAVWRWENLYQIVVDLAASLGTASVIIFLILAAVYRSVRLGLISIVPNLFPLTVTAAYLALAGYNLEIVMVCSFTICLGIAVDDTIHFLTRYEEERLQTDDEHLAIRRAFTGVGTALIMTTLVLVAGFATVTVSESRDHRIFATMGALTISAALFGDLIFLPALLARFSPRRPHRAEHQRASGELTSAPDGGPLPTSIDPPQRTSVLK